MVFSYWWLAPQRGVCYLHVKTNRFTCSFESTILTFVSLTCHCGAACQPVKLSEPICQRRFFWLVIYSDTVCVDFLTQRDWTFITCWQIDAPLIWRYISFVWITFLGDKFYQIEKRQMCFSLTHFIMLRRMDNNKSRLVCNSSLCIIYSIYMAQCIHIAYG